jgi:hypothetical protein
MNQRSVLVLFSVFTIASIQSCMKNKCYQCVTIYPQVGIDSFSMQDSVHAYCDITMEKKEVIETSGSFSKVYHLKDSTLYIQTTTTCK